MHHRLLFVAASSALLACDPVEPAIVADTAPPLPTVAPVVPLPAAPAVEFLEDKPARAPGALPAITPRAPAKQQLIETGKSADFEIKFDVRNWKLEPTGKAVHVVLDNRKVRRVHDLKKPLKLGDFTGGAALSEGFHLLAILPVHAGGESVKPVNKRSAVAVVPFYVGKKTDPTWKEGEPLLLLNAPTSGKIPKEGALVDFQVINTELARGKVVVHAAVSGPDLSKGESLHQWRPWRIKNAHPGDYLIKLELFHYVPDSFESGSAVSVSLVSKPMPGPWTSVTREFVLDAP